MKRFFLCCFFLLLPLQVFAREDFAQGVFKQILIEEGSEGENSSANSKFSGQFIGDLNLGDNYQATDRQNEYKDAYSRLRLNTKLKITNRFSINSLARLERVTTNSETERRSNNPGAKNTYFQNEAAFLQEVAAKYDYKNTSVIAGKFTANFGTAWQYGRGIWNYELARNYKETEKLGVGAVVRAGNIKKTGLYNFSFASFTNDRKNLDNSVITNRDSDVKSDAKAGDTRSLKSYVGAMDVLFDFSEKEKLSYHFSYIDLAVNGNASAVSAYKLSDQKGYAAAMNYRYPVTENFLLDSLLEYVRMKNIDGNSDISEQYSTASLVGEFYRNWNVSLSTTNLARKDASSNGYDKNLSEISFGYQFDKTVFFDKLLLQVGYKNLRTNYKTSVETNNSYGALLRYVKLF